MYTDGSKIEGKVGATLSVWTNGEETRTRKLEEYCSVYQAELLALLEATRLALRGKSLSVRVYCDSRSALETVVNNSSQHPLAVQIRDNMDLLRGLGKTMDLYWVKAHVGLVGNERADELAKSAALGLKTKAAYDKCPVSFVKRQIRLESIDEWNRRYKQKNSASVTKIFFPDAVIAYPLVEKLEVDPALTQLMTGHGGFASYLHRFKCRDSPSCPCDPEKEENVMHIICECPLYSRNRFDVEQELGISVNIDNIAKIVENKESRDKFMNYCKKLVDITKVRNK